MFLRKSIGIGFLLLQIILIISARFTDSRYFCWAPHDSQNEYHLNVFINGRVLTADEIIQRYRIKQTGVDPRSIQHIKDIIMQYESTYAQGKKARIIMDYQTNGIPQKQWQWPQS